MTKAELKARVAALQMQENPKFDLADFLNRPAYLRNEKDKQIYFKKIANIVKLPETDETLAEHFNSKKEIDKELTVEEVMQKYKQEES